MEPGLAPRPAGAPLNSTILCLNGGSSSLKFALYRPGGKAGGEALLAEGAVERLGLAGARLWARRSGGAEPVDARLDEEWLAGIHRSNLAVGRPHVGSTR